MQQTTGTGLRARAGIALGIVASGLALVAVVLSLFSPAPGLWLPIGGLALTSVAYGTVGGLIASRVPSNPVGWLLVCPAVAVSITVLALAVISATQVDGDASPGLLQVVTGWILVLLPLSVAPSSLIAALLYYPDGRLPSRWFLPAVWAVVAAGLLQFVGYLAAPWKLGLSSLHLLGPRWAIHLPGFDAYPQAGGFLLLAAGLAAVAAISVRYRRGTPQERGPLRWIQRLLLAFVLTLPLPFLLGWIGFMIAALVGALVVFFGIPAALAVGVLKYRLYEIDFVIRKTLVGAAMVIFVVLVFSLVVLVPTMFTRGLDLTLLLPSLAIAFGLGPVRRWARRGADRLLYGQRATPHEVLSEFAERVGETYSTDDVLPRMAELLAAGTGASEARVWLRTGGSLRPAAVAPSTAATLVPLAISGNELPPISDVSAIFPVEHAGELLGALTLLMPPSDPMNASKDRLAKDLASQASLLLQNVRLVEDLRESRRRIVTAQDERARKLERDIHDGAQQQLVALAVKLRLAEQLTQRDLGRAQELLGQLQTDATDALETLRDLARGIYPPLLADKGLAAALEAQTRKAGLPVRISADGVGRFEPDVEAAVYFCALEALQNAAKHAAASDLLVTLDRTDRHLTFEVRDDGRGFDPAATGYGTGLQGMADRLSALGGTLEVRSAPGAGTTVLGSVPGEAPARSAG